MENKEKMQNKYQNVKEMDEKIMKSQEYYKWKDLKIWMQKYLQMIEKISIGEIGLRHKHEKLTIGS